MSTPSVNQSASLPSLNSIENNKDVNVLDKKTQKVAFPILNSIGQTFSYGASCLQYVFNTIVNSVSACISSVSKLFSSVFFSKKEKISLPVESKTEPSAHSEEIKEMSEVKEVAKQETPSDEKVLVDNPLVNNVAVTENEELGLKETLIDLYNEIKEEGILKQINKISFVNKMVEEGESFLSKYKAEFDIVNEVGSKIFDYLSDKFPKDKVMDFIFELQELTGIELITKTETIKSDIAVDSPSEEVVGAKTETEEGTVVAPMLSKNAEVDTESLVMPEPLKQSTLDVISSEAEKFAQVVEAEVDNQSLGMPEHIRQRALDVLAKFKDLQTVTAAQEAKPAQVVEVKIDNELLGMPEHLRQRSLDVLAKFKDLEAVKLAEEAKPEQIIEVKVDNESLGMPEHLRQRTLDVIAKHKDLEALKPAQEVKPAQVEEVANVPSKRSWRSIVESKKT